MKKLITILFSLALLIPTSVFAQNKDVKLNIIGSIEPSNTITVKLSYPYIDLGGTKIIWLNNDEVAEEGIGMTTHSVDLGALGSKIKITAIIGIPNSKGQVQNSITISPAVMDILWEAQTTVPPFYHGKAVPSNESPVKTFAIAYFGTSTPNTAITYSWTKNKTISMGEGINLVNALFLGAWENKSTEVSVTAKYADLIANKTVKIPSYKPSIVFYEVSPTQGILTQEVLNNNPIKNTIELAVQAIPFGFANKERIKDQIQYDWSIGSNKIKSGRGSSFETVTFSKSDISLKTGEIAIKLLAQNVINVMQYSETTFKWAFTE